MPFFFFSKGLQVLPKVKHIQKAVLKWFSCGNALYTMHGKDISDHFLALSANSSFSENALIPVQHLVQNRVTRNYLNEQLVGNLSYAQISQHKAVKSKIQTD